MLNKLYSLLVFVVAFVCFSSCSEEEAGGIEYSMGRVECYDDFLWNEYSPVMKKKQLKFVFEADALSEDASFKMGFFTIGEDGKTEPMGTDVAQVYVNGEPVDNNQFEVSNKVDGKYVENVTLELGVVFNPDAATGVHKWEVCTIETEKKMMEEVAVVNKDNRIVFSVEKVDKIFLQPVGLIDDDSYLYLCNIDGDDDEEVMHKELFLLIPKIHLQKGGDIMLKINPLSTLYVGIDVSSKSNYVCALDFYK